MSKVDPNQSQPGSAQPPKLEAREPVADIIAAQKQRAARQSDEAVAKRAHQQSVEQTRACLLRACFEHGRERRPKGAPYVTVENVVFGPREGRHRQLGFGSAELAARIVDLATALQRCPGARVYERSRIKPRGQGGELAAAILDSALGGASPAQLQKDLDTARNALGKPGHGDENDSEVGIWVFFCDLAQAFDDGRFRAGEAPSTAARSASAEAVVQSHAPVPIAAAVVAGVTDPLPQPATRIIQDDGDCWHFAFDGEEGSVKSARGHKLLAVLLERPDQSFDADGLNRAAGEAPAWEGSRVPDEPTSTEIRKSEISSALPACDQQAIAATTKQLRECEAELERASRMGDQAETERLRKEIQGLSDYLKSNVNRDGTPKATGGDVKNARDAATKAVDRAIETLRNKSPVLGDHLRRYIATGALFGYRAPFGHPAATPWEYRRRPR